MTFTRRTGAAVLATTLAALLAPAVAPAQQPADPGGFRDILPAGQGETVNAAELAAAQASGKPPASFTSQEPLYDGLVGAAPNLAAADLDRYFKPEAFGVAAADAGAQETPRPGVRIVRDKPHAVPHVFGDTRADVMYGAGYASAEDRLFLMDVLRHTGRARLTELIGPGDGDSTVKMDADQLKVADYSEEELQAMIDRVRTRAGAEGAVIQADLDAYVAGINQYIGEARTDPTKLPAEYPALGQLPADWKATDTVAIASLIGGIFGKGGGGEVRAEQALAQARARFGDADGRKVFDDFRAFDDPEAPVTTTTRFGFDDPGAVDPAAVASPDLGSVQERNPVTSDVTGPATPLTARARRARAARGARPAPRWLKRLQRRGIRFPREQSNALLVGADESQSGHPIAVMGPQVGYYSPEILMELDLHGGGIDARGATFPGISLYILIGRGRDFAWSTTTAYSDNVDEYVEKLCNTDGSPPTRSSDHYLYKGACTPFTERDHVLHTPIAPTSPALPRTITMRVQRSVHGPIQGTALVAGVPVAISEARSTYRHEIDSTVAYKRLNDGEVTSPQTFLDAFSHDNFAFNHFYVDADHIAYITSGDYPVRAKGTDPSLPAWGTGEWDWAGFDPATFDHDQLTPAQHPTQVDPPRGYFTNWNNKQAPGWHAADDNFTFGSLQRVQRLEKRVRAGIAGGRKMTLTELTQAMADAATVDLRGQESYPLLRRVLGDSTDPALAEPLRLLDAWAAAGGHRRDLDGDGVDEDSAAVALMDAWWEPLMRGIFAPALGDPLVERIRTINPFSQTPGTGNQGSSFFDGWHGYADKDLRALLGDPVQAPLSRRYCGGGSLADCRAILAATLAQAAATVRSQYGVSDLADVKIRSTGCESDPICDEIQFQTAGAVDTPPMPWQDRPTFQQVVELGANEPVPTSGTAATPTPTPTATATPREAGTTAPQARQPAAPASGSASAGGGSLPFTGYSLGGVALLALALLGGGAALRRRTRRS